MLCQDRTPRENTRGWIVFLLIVGALIVARVPVMFREPGEIDEECYSVPGLMVLKTGIPSLPHIPGRHPESVFFHADTVLFAEPPLYFYLQAPFYAVFPPKYGSARLLTMAAGIAVLGLMWNLARRWFGSMLAAAWCAGLFSMSRWFFLQVIRARPDMVCTAFGLAALWAVCRWQQDQRPRWLVLTGLLIGLGGMTHPFALVYAVQIAVWLAWDSRGWRRIARPALVATVSMLVVMLWLPLIVQHPDIFEVQFRNQFLTPHDSLWERAFMPWKPFLYHGKLMLHQIQPWQFFIAVGGLAISTLLAWSGGTREARTATGLAWSSVYLMLFLVGTHHHVPGYWTYPTSLMFICVGGLIQHIRRWLPQPGTRFAWTAPALGVLLALSMIPQSRLGTLVAHLGNWHDINYNAPRFAQQIMAEIPPEALCAVDSEFLFDFVVAGRNVVLARAEKITIQVDQMPYEYVIGSRMAMDGKVFEKLPGHLIRTWGDKQNLYGCYAEAYHVQRSSSEIQSFPRINRQ